MKPPYLLLITLFILCPVFMNGQGLVEKIAGDATIPPDGSLASEVSFPEPSRGVTDSQDNLYFLTNLRVVMIEASTQRAFTIAGAGDSEFTEGALAKDLMPFGYTIAVDNDDNVILGAFNRIFRINSETGMVETIAGTGEQGYSGDGGDARLAQITAGTVTFDPDGNLFFADALRIRRVDVSTNIITTIAGTGSDEYSGDGGDPLNASFNEIVDIQFIGNDQLFVMDQDDEFGDEVIRQIDLTLNIIDLFYELGFSYGSASLAKDNIGRLVFVQAEEIAVFIGNIPESIGSSAYRPIGECFYRKEEETDFTFEIVFTQDGGHFIFYTIESYIARFDASENEIGNVGNGRKNWFGDGGPLSEAGILNPQRITIASDGTIYFMDQEYTNTNIISQRYWRNFQGTILRRVDPVTHEISTVVGFMQDWEVNGNQECLFLDSNSGITVDKDNNVIFTTIPDFFSFEEKSVMGRYNPKTGEISQLIVEGEEGWNRSPDFINDDIDINDEDEIVYPGAGDIFWADIERKILRSTGVGEINTNINALALDRNGIVHVSRGFEHTVNMIVGDESDDAVSDSFVAGNGMKGFSGDGGPAKQAMLNNPRGIAFDRDNNLYIADHDNNRIRKVKDGVITTIASINQPNDLAFDQNDNLIVVAETGIFKISGLVEPPYTKRTIYRSESAGNQEVPKGMIFWNSMDSKDEVENSVWGPDIQQTTYIFPLWGEARIEPALFGNGLFINHDDGGGQRGDGANFFAIDNRDMNLSARKGTIEFLFKFGEDYTYESTRPNTIYYAFLFAMHNTLAGEFTRDEILDETGLLMQLIWDGRTNVRRYLYQIAEADLDIWNTGWTSASQSENVKFEKGEIAHFALVWDVNGIDGSNQTSVLYINGIQEASTNGIWPEDAQLKNYTYLGALPGSPSFYGTDQSWNAHIGVIDNLKIWDRPLNPMEFMDNAKSFEGFVEIPETRSIAEGEDTSPESLGYPKVWTLCDGEISYTYRDVDNGASISRYWTVTTPCGESAEVMQEIIIEGDFAVQSLTLIRPKDNKELKVLKDLDFWYLQDSWRPNIRADVSTTEDISKVVFTVNGEVINVDYTAPYAIGPNNSSNFGSILIGQGVKTICATPYAKVGDKEVAGTAKCVRLTFQFTLPAETRGEGMILSPPGSYMYGDVKPMAWYQFTANFDHETRAFSGNTTFDFGGPALTFNSDELDHFFQRKRKHTLFWYGEIDGVDDYLMEQQFFYKNDVTLARIRVTQLSTGEVIYDSERGTDPWEFPTGVAMSDDYAIGEPIWAEIDGDWILEFEQPLLGVYPNPFVDRLNLSVPIMEVDVVRWTLTDLRGRLVMAEEARTGTITEIDVSTLPMGVYIFTIDTADDKYSFRVVK